MKSPPTPLVVPFTKMHGAGNDFIVLDNRFMHFTEEELQRLARSFCPRRFGVGADGLLALEDPSEEGFDYRMRYYNADGSIARMCGNGARCLARFAHAAGVAGKPDGETVNLSFQTEAGPYAAEVPAEGDVALGVPPPRDFRPDIAESAAGPVHFVWTGTEHAVVMVDAVAEVAVEKEGAAIRNAAAFVPLGTNADFVELAAQEGDHAHLLVRTYERGVEAETLACGTGVLAAAVVAALTRAEGASRFTVDVPGGRLGVAIQWRAGAPDTGRTTDDIEGLTLAGPAETVFQGTLEMAAE